MTRTGLFDYGVVRIDWRNAECAMKHYFLFLAAASALTLAACQNGPPEAPPPGPISPGPGPAIPPPPQIGTAGPLTQAGVGKYMDGQEMELRTRLRNLGVGVLRRGNDIMLTFPDNRLFEGMKLSSSGRSLLETVALVLRRYGHSQILVNGYTDTSGSAEQNLDVSQKRAALVAEALAAAGVAKARTEVHGFGETSLKVMTGDNISEPRNRRIELRIVPRPG
jgi:outer membrane protein OmpA-like peptidoglycan-associated protein